MQFLESLIGDDAWPLIGAIAFAALVLAITLVATGRGRLLVGIIILAALVPLVLMVEWIWVTDRERVDSIIDQLAVAARNEDAAEMARYLSPKCRFGPLGRDEIQHRAAAIFQRFVIDRVSISSRKTMVFPHRKEATAEFLAVVRGKQNIVDFTPYPTRWILAFTQDSGGSWLVVEIQQIAAMGENRQPLSPTNPADIGQP